MADILTVGATSLQQLSQALNTTGHNITNVNTEGYSRQDVNFRSAPSQQFGFGFVGQGAQIESIERSYDRYLTDQVRHFTSTQSLHQAFVNFSSRVDDIMANSTSSMNTSMQRFFSAMQDVSASPSSLPERQVLIGEAKNLVDRQQTFNDLLADLNRDINNALRANVAEINGYADSIAKLNQNIVSAISTGNGALPNDLLDQRDMLLKKLAEKVSVNAVEQRDGTMNIFVGKGQALVVGSQTTHLRTQNNAFDSSVLELGVEGQTASSALSKFYVGGEIEGMMDFRDRVLLPARDQLGLIALGLSENLNAQHQLGMDMNGAMGGNLFAAPTVSVVSNVANTGSGAPVVSLNDVSEVRAGNYRLDYNGAQWQLTRQSDGTSVSGAGPLVLDGMSVDLGAGVPAAGDSFLFNPAREAAENFAVAITDPRKIAAAAPVQSQPALGNTGTGSISEPVIDPVNTLPLAAPISLSFNPDALGAGVPGFDVIGGPGGTIAYDPATESAGKSFTFAAEGISFDIEGEPLPGDSFSISGNAGATGDNRNILKMGELQHQPLLNGGKNDFQEYFGSLVARVGVLNREASTSLEVESSLLQQAAYQQQSVSGVNLDQEAANLLRYQQAYQASAQMIKVADEMFQILINSVG